MEKIITGILIIAFFGWPAMDNCCTEKEGCVADCTKECCDDSECGADCAKACCLGCKATDGDAKCKEGHSCCAVSEKVEDNENDSTDVTDSTEADETLTEEDNIEESDIFDVDLQDIR